MLSNHTVFKIITAFLVSVPTVLITSCSSISAPNSSQHIQNYTQLNKQADGSYSYINEKLKNYKQIHIKPAEFITQKNQSKALAPTSKKELLSTFDNALKNNLKTTKQLQLSNVNGEKTICIRPIITLIEQPNIYLNYTATALLIGPITRGGATTIIDAYDCVTQERLAAESMTAMASAFGNFSNSYSKLGHAKIKLEESAKHFSNLINQK